jgi:hypothetical protein
VQRRGDRDLQRLKVLPSFQHFIEDRRPGSVGIAKVMADAPPGIAASPRDLVGSRGIGAAFGQNGNRRFQKALAAVAAPPVQARALRAVEAFGLRQR